MYGYGAEFQKYLLEFPNSRPANIENFIYWSKDKFGMKPVVSITHVTIYRVSAANGSDILIASKGSMPTIIRKASLGLTGFIKSRSSDPPRYTTSSISTAQRRTLCGDLFAGLKRTLDQRQSSRRREEEHGYHQAEA